jgi:hypothetical protein
LFFDLAEASFARTLGLALLIPFGGGFKLRLKP